jgi:signal peptidase I
VDGAPAACPRKVAHLRYYAYGSLVNGREAPCGAGYFVLGDDSPDSQDSRFEGPVERADIVGRAWLVLWPPSRIGFVNP